MPIATPTLTTREIKQGLLARFGGPEDDLHLEAVIGMLPDFRRSALEALFEMRDALSRREQERLRLAAHTMKGNSSRLGLQKLVIHCGEVERLAQEDAFAAAALELRQLAAEYRQVQTVLDELVAGQQASGFPEDVF